MIACRVVEQFRIPQAGMPLVKSLGKKGGMYIDGSRWPLGRFIGLLLSLQCEMFDASNLSVPMFTFVYNPIGQNREISTCCVALSFTVDTRYAVHMLR